MRKVVIFIKYFVFCLVIGVPANIYGIYVKEFISNINGLTNNSVNCILEDSENVIWVGTWDGLNAYNGRSILSFRYSKNDSTSISNNIIRQIIEHRNFLWIATDNGVNKFDRESKKFTRYYLGNKIPRQENSYVLAQSPEGKLFCWVKGYGIFIYDDTKDQFCLLKVDLDKSYIDFLIDKEGHVVFLSTEGYARYLRNSNELISGKLDWLELHQKERIQKIILSDKYLITASKSKIVVFDSRLHQLYSIDIDTNKKISDVVITGKSLVVGFIEGGCKIYDLSTMNCSTLKEVTEQTSVVTLYLGSQDIWWIGTDGQGIMQLLPYQSLFHRVVTENPVRCFCEDGKGNIIVGTKGSGIKLFDVQKKLLLNFLDESNGLPSMSVYALKKNQYGDIFIGTEGKGIGVLQIGKKEVKMLDIPAKYPYFRSVYSLYFTNNDSLLWVGTSGYGLIRINIRKENGGYKVLGLKQYISSNTNNPLNNDIVYAIAADTSGRYVWFGTRGGGLNRVDIIEDKIQPLEELYSNIHLTNNDVLCLSQDRNEIWIGTSYGLNKLSVGNNPFVTQYAEQLVNKTVHGILKDKQGNIWAGTTQGLIHLEVNTNKIEDYTFNDGLHNDEFADGAYFSDGNNQLYFGGVNGFSYFTPDNIHLRDFNPLLVLESIKIFNTPQDVNSRIKDGILRLDYEEKAFTLTFLTKDFIKNGNCEYAYRFCDRSPNWIYMGNNPNLSFGQLQPGVYHLEVKTTNGDKVWGTNVYQLTVKVGYPWWLKTPALLVYAVICIITIYITKRIIVGRIRLSKQILIARVETAHEQKIYESKLNFFTNVAHEFFTPLTLIYTPVQYLLEKKDLSDDSRKYLNIIKDNAERMQRLIRELMDFRKAGARNLDICPEQIDIKELIDSVISNYVDILRENKITIHVENRCSLSLYSDRNSLEKILFNLLSNAFKYTPRLGVIQIYAVQKEDSSLNFTIRNSEKGLTDKQMAAIFDRYKIFDAPYLENSVSNGIGLNLTKQLVEILEGTIKVNSVLGKYVEFEVFIPPLGADKASILTCKTVEVHSPHQEEDNEVSYTQTPTVLIVEDDEYLRHLLYDILKDYILEEASNGKEALMKVRQNHPDIILTDMIMEPMDGLTFIRTLKADPHTSYIPIVVVSGKATVEDQVKACNYGADVYLTKPFHPLQVISTVENLLSRQQALKDYFNSSLSAVKIKDGRELHPDDEKFLEDVSGLVAEHIDEEELNPVWVAERLGMSKASLYRKFKEILDKTPGEFIRSIRLEHAAKLLRTTQLTVSEIMFRCGFSNKSYFYREFLKQYGYSPKDYRNRENGK